MDVILDFKHEGPGLESNFLFGRRKPFFETHFCYLFFYSIISFWIISLLFYLFFLFIHFKYFYSFRFGRDKPAKLSRPLQCLNRWIRPRSRSFLGKGQLAPVLCRRQCRFASIAVQYQGREVHSFPTRLLI